MTTLLDFPLELQDLVIDHTHDQKHVLAISALVNKSWLLSSRHHLFGSVILHDRNWKAFVQLQGSPLATFTQSISAMTISLSYNGESFKELVSGLRVLPTLQHLRLEDIYWPGITESTTNSLVMVFPNIRELDIHQVSFDSPPHMATLVSRFPQLQSASLYPIFLEYGSALQASHYPEIPRNLERLRLRPTIRVLELGILDAHGLHSVGNLLRALGPDLHDLNLKLHHFNADDIRTHIDLSQNTNMHSFTLHMSLRRFHSATSLRAPWALLSVTCSPISTLTLVLSIDIRVVDPIDKFDWAYLNMALETYPQLAALRRLHLIVHGSSLMDSNIMEDAIRTRVQKHTAIVEVTLLHKSRVFTHGEELHF
ncbi:hypothetical protein MVEN_00964500 [Mycena venus]|uniref:Uncharacterized protein n=1 Tax=Mycena venus TaxID=2733690 RepID=A0A8H7D1U2_9AGAR|nr:hypothetical protein MVEN_00964500 [Mycena venus]